MENKQIIYGILPVFVSKSYDKVFNKQIIIAKYEFIEEENGKNKIELIELIAVSGTQKQAYSREHTFSFAFSFDSRNLIEIHDNIDNISIEQAETINTDVEFYESFELAKLAKYVYMANIRTYLNEHLKEVRTTIEKVLPRNIDKEIEAIYNEMPEYLI